jgi:hypothetical protein
MQIEHLQHEFERVQANLADSPVLPSVTVDCDQIRHFSWRSRCRGGRRKPQAGHGSAKNKNAFLSITITTHVTVVAFGVPSAPGAGHEAH